MVFHIILENELTGVAGIGLVPVYQTDLAFIPEVTLQ